MKCLRWASAVLFLASCGQDPSFTEVGAGSSKQRDAIGSGDGSGASSDGSVESGGIVLDPIDPDVIAENGSSPSSPSSPGVPPSSPSSPGVPPSSPSSPGVPPSSPSSPAPGGGTVISSNPSNPTAPTFTIPNASPDDVNQIKKCVMKWGNVPFVGPVTSYRRIAAAVTVGGYGVSVSDTQQTSGPALVLVDAGVNVFGSPIYDMLNQNAYYCIKVNVNVNTSLTVNLACNARLADTSVQVNVNSTTNGGTSAIGVNVGSTVNIQRMTPSRQSCPN